MSADLAVPLTGGRAELRLARQAGLVLALLALPVVGVSAALHGAAGAAGAAAGLGLVAILFVVAALGQGFAARRSPSAMLTILCTGLGIRIMSYLAALSALGQVSSLHRPSLAMATALGVVVTLHHEMRVIRRTPELFWVEADLSRSAERPGASLSTRRS